MHQDVQDEDKNESSQLVEQGEETVRELFNFKFNLLFKPPKVTEDKNEQEFQTDGRLKLVLSQDTKKLMVIIDNDTFCIYNRDNSTHSQGQPIEWKLDPKRQFIKFPYLLQNKMEANFLFDPTFTYFIDRDHTKKCFSIVQTDEKHFRNIPVDQISAKSLAEEGDCFHLSVKRVQKLFFSSEKTVEYITSSGMWFMLDIGDKSGVEKSLGVLRYTRMNNW